MARRFSGMSYDYGAGGGGGNYGYGFQAPAADTGADDFAEGFASLAKVLMARRAEDTREKRSADVFYRQNTKHIPADKLREFEKEFDTGLDPKLAKTPEGRYAKAEHAIKKWDAYRQEVTTLEEDLKRNAAEMEAVRKAQEKTSTDLTKDFVKQRSDALAEQQREQKAGQTYAQRLATQARTTEAARRAAARAGLPPDSVVGPEAPERPAQAMKSVPIYKEGDEQGFNGVFEQVEIPKSDPRTWLSEEEAAQIRGGGGPATPTSPRPRQAESLVADAAAAPAPRTPAPQRRNAEQLREAATAPVAKPAQTAPARRPEAPPHAAPRTAQEIYENTTWNKAVTNAKKAVNEEEKAWSTAGAEVHAQNVLDEYVAWRDANGLPPLDEREERLARTRVKVQLSGYGAGPNRGRRVTPSISRPGEPEFKSQQPFGLTAEERNAIAEAAWDDPNRPYPGLYAEKPARTVPAPIVAPKPKEPEGFFDRPITESIVGALGLRVPESAMPPAQSLANESRPGAVPPPVKESPAPLGMEPAGLFGVPTIMGAPVRADDTMTPAELTQYREVEKEKKSMASLATFAATRVLQNGGTREQAMAAAEEAVTRQAANLEQQMATKQHMLAAPASRQIAAMIDENLTPRAAAKMAVQAAVMAAATYLTGGGALAAAGGAAAGNVIGQVALNKPDEPVSLKQAALEGATVGLASKIPLGGIGRVLGTGPVGTTVAGGVREGVQEMGEEGIGAVLEGRPIEGRNLAVAGILGAVYGPVFEVAISAIPAPARASVQEAAAQAAQQGADAAQVAQVAAQAAQAAGLTPEAVAGVQADVEAALAGTPPPAAPAEPGSPAAPFGSPAAPVPVEAAPAAPQTAEDLAAAAAEVEAGRTVAATPAPPTRRGRRGRTAPATATEAAPTTPEPTEAPPAAPDASPDFRAWVDQNLGGGTYAALEADFRATGDASQLTALRAAYQQGQTAGGDPIAARGLAQIQSDPLSANALREQAARFEQERLAAARVAPPPTAPAAGHYAVMQGPDGQFYVATVVEPEVTRREAEGEAGPRAGGRRAIMGPFRDGSAAQTAAGLMNERFTAEFGEMPEPGSLADLDPRAVLDWERRNAREVYRGAPRQARAGGRNIGSGKASPSVLEPGTAARLREEAAAATKAATTRKARPPRKGRKPVKPPSTAIAAPAAEPLSGADAMLEALRQQAAEAEAARAALPPGMAEEVTTTEAALDDDAGIMADINEAISRATSAEQLAGLLEISTEEAQTLIDGAEAESRGGTVAMSDPFGAGLIQGILDRRAVDAAEALKQRLAERRALREAASPEIQATRERRRQLEADPDTLLREGKIVQGEILRNQPMRVLYGANMPQQTFDALEGYKQAAISEAMKEKDPAKRRYKQVADEPELKAWIVKGRQRTLGGLTKEQFLNGEQRNPRTRSDPRNDPRMTREELEVFFDRNAMADINGPLDETEFDKMVIWTPDFGALGNYGKVSQMGGPDTTRRSRDMLRALDLAARLGAEFESQHSISPDTAKLYNNLWTMTGIPASRMAGMKIADIINHPGVRQFTERFKQREGRGNMPPATADFMGLSQAFNVAKSAWNALTNAASNPGPKAGSVGRALLTGPRSTLEHLADLGPAGKAATDLFETYRDVKESLHGKWSSQLDSALGKVTEDQRSAFVDLLEGKSTVAKPETTQAAAETRAMLDDVARLAATNERFAGYIVDYFPRIMAERPSLARKAKAAALDMWQDPGHKKKMQAMGITNWSDPAAASYAATQLMFPTGGQYGALAPNLEKHRTGLLQEYRTDPEVLYQYLAQASKAISHAMVFDSPRVTGPSQTTGKTMERYGGWKQLWGMLGANPDIDADTLAGLRQALEREMGIEQAAPTTGSQIEQSIRDIVASTSLALSFTNQPLSFADTAATLGLGRSIGALSALRSQQAIDAAVRAGSVRSQGEAKGRSFAEENLLAEKSGVSGALGTVAKAYRDMPWMDWMQGIDRAMRITSDAASRASLAETVANIKAGDKATLDLLKAAGVDPQSLASLTPQEVQAAMTYGQMSPQAQRRVDIFARRMVELTQQRGRPGDLPKSWSGAYGSWVSMFMPFKYRQMKSMLKVIEAKGLPAFLASGLPAYIALGGITAAMRAVLTGYGFRGEENDEQTTWEKFQSIFGNRPIKAVAGEDSPTDFLLRAAQTLVRAVPAPFAMAIAQRAERAKDAESLASTIMGPAFRVIQSGATALQGVTGSGRPEDVGEAEWAARGIGAGLGQMFGPSAYSYQLKRELMGPEGNFPRKTLQPQASPGLVGRGLDLARGEITPGQFLKGVVVGGEDTLSARRKKRRANVKEDRRRRGKLSSEAKTYETIRVTPSFE